MISRGWWTKQPPDYPPLFRFIKDTNRFFTVWRDWNAFNPGRNDCWKFRIFRRSKSARYEQTETQEHREEEEGASVARFL